MKARARIARFVLCLAATMAFGLTGAQAFADDATGTLAAGAADLQAQAADQKLDGVLIDRDRMPGVYKVVAEPGAEKDKATISIPSVSKQNLVNSPTKESPAIIMGAAVNYETRTGATQFTPIAGKKLLAPYSYFRWSVMDQQTKNVDGTITTQKKLTGFDGSYYIVRVDVSNLINGVGDGKYLHVRQTGNKALMVAAGHTGTDTSDSWTFTDALGNRTASYSLANNAAALKDKGADDIDKATPYIDVIMLSSGKLAAGADAGATGEPNGDIELSLYVDGTQDYKPWLKPLDPNTTYTWPMTVKDGNNQDVKFDTELKYNEALLTKYYDDTASNSGQNKSVYNVKASDLEIDVMVDDRDVAGDKPDFWSLTSAMGYQKYDSHTIKLICEVPVLEGLSVKSTTGGKRSVILDVNSFDIQIANNNTKNQAGLSIENNAELRIKDGSNTSGAELAIGNNATMVIKKNGVLVIDETCTNEVEYDAATTTTGTPTKDMINGEITVENGGKLVNYGVINIEGAESKPKQPATPGQQPDTPVVTDVKRSDMFVNYGGQLDNYGTLSLKGDLYVLGTLNNYGMYKDIINAYDPDKGRVAYHKGIQVTWKDVVTDKGIEPGVLNIGIDANKKVEKRAVLNNYGDIVLVPGTLNVYGTFNQRPNPDASKNYSGHLYQCTADEAIIPVIDPNDPLHVEDKVKVNPPKKSVFNYTTGTFNNSEGFVGTAKVALIHNGVLGDLTPLSLSMQDKKVIISPDAFTYNAKTQKPAVQTIGGMKLTEGTDYTITWSNPSSKNVGSYTMTLVGKGLYSGRSLATYKINVLNATPKVTLAKNPLSYTGKTVKPSLTVVANGIKLSASDYTLKYYKGSKAISAKNVKATGNYKVKVTLKGNCKGTKTIAFKVAPGKPKMSTTGSLYKRTLEVNYNKIKGATSYVVAYRKVGASKWTTKSAGSKTTYTIRNLKAGALYEVKVAAKSGNIRGNWSNVSRRYLQRVSSFKVTAGNKQFTATWNGPKATKYQLKYSTSSDLQNSGKFVNASGKQSGKVIVKNLKQKKRYYAWVRPLKVYKGKTYYGVYSPGRSVRTK